MAAYRMRPRFELVLSISPDEALDKLKQLLEGPECKCIGKFRQNHAQISVCDKHRHFWSPYVTLEFEEKALEDKAGSQVHGLIGPSSNVWTMFMAGYFGVLFFAFVALTLGYSQWSIKQPAWGFKLLPVIGVLLVLWYGLSFLGQRFAKDQIANLRDLLDNSLAPHILQEEDI